MRWTLRAIVGGGAAGVTSDRLPSGLIEVTCHGESSLFPLTGLLVGFRSEGVRVTVTIWAVPFGDFMLVVETFRVTVFPPENEVSFGKEVEKTELESDVHKCLHIDLML